MNKNVTRSEIADKIGEMRRDWVEVAEGVSLLDVKASIGFVLLDLAETFGLTKAQTKAALGDRLNREIDEELNARNIQLVQ